MKSFKQFLIEETFKAPLPKTKEETEKILWDFEDCIEGGIANCEIIDTTFGPAVNVIGDVNIKALSLEYIPVRFHRVKGKFDCSFNKELKSVEGAPVWTKGNADFQHCESLTNLDYLGLMGFQSEGVVIFDSCFELERVCDTGKMIYSHGYIFSRCPKLTSLKGIGTNFGNLSIAGTAIHSLHDFHKHVKFSKNAGPGAGDLVLFNGRTHQEITECALNLMLVEGLKSITYNEKIAPWFKIIEDGINNGLDVMDVQDQLLDAGYTDQAKI